MDARLEVLKSRVGEELALQAALAEVQGCLEPILATSLMAGLSLAAK